MKNISYWASRHPLMAKMLLALLHLLSTLNAVWLGSQLYLGSWIAPHGLMLVFVALFFFAYLMYPRSRNNEWLFSWNYTRQKALDFTLVVAATMALALGFNRLLVTTDATSPEGLARFTTYAPADQQPAGVKPFSGKAVRKQLRRAVRQVKKKVRHSNERSRRDWNRFLLIFLGVTISLGLALLVAGLSCSISCSGQEQLAAVVLIGGWLGIIGLFILGIRLLNRKLPRIKQSDEM
jgi:hypothetical protein